MSWGREPVPSGASGAPDGPVAGHEPSDQAPAEACVSGPLPPLQGEPGLAAGLAEGQGSANPGSAGTATHSILTATGRSGRTTQSHRCDKHAQRARHAAAGDRVRMKGEAGSRPWARLTGGGRGRREEQAAAGALGAGRGGPRRGRCAPALSPPGPAPGLAPALGPHAAPAPPSPPNPAPGGLRRSGGLRVRGSALPGVCVGSGVCASPACCPGVCAFRGSARSGGLRGPGRAARRPQQPSPRARAQLLPRDGVIRTGCGVRRKGLRALFPARPGPFLPYPPLGKTVKPVYLKGGAGAALRAAAGRRPPGRAALPHAAALLRPGRPPRAPTLCSEPPVAPRRQRSPSVSRDLRGPAGLAPPLALEVPSPAALCAGGARISQAARSLSSQPPGPPTPGQSTFPPAVLLMPPTLSAALRFHLVILADYRRHPFPSEGGQSQVQGRFPFLSDLVTGVSSGPWTSTWQALGVE